MAEELLHLDAPGFGAGDFNDGGDDAAAVGQACLLDDEIELFVADIREFEGDPQLHIEPLRVHPGVLFCHPQHPLLQRQPVGLQDLLDYPLAGTQLPEEVSAALRNLGAGASPLTIQCDNFMVLKELVSSSHVVSLAPWDVIAQDVASGRLAPLQISTQEMEFLQQYNWPGNVRELRNLIERSLIFGYYDLKPEPASAVGSQPPLPVQDTSLEAVEKRHILAVLDACGGNKSEAARQLGVSRKTLDRKCTAWGV